MALPQPTGTYRADFRRTAARLQRAMSRLNQMEQLLDDIEEHSKSTEYLAAAITRRENAIKLIYARITALDTALDTFLGA